MPAENTANYGASEKADLEFIAICNDFENIDTGDLKINPRGLLAHAS